jgi:hypothetical protein
MAWREGGTPKEPGLGEDPTTYRKQHTGQLGWCRLVNCPRAVDRNLVVEDEPEEYPWQEDIYLEVEKRQRWVLDSQIIANGQSITLTSSRFELRRNEMLFVMLTMRSWGFESRNERSVTITKRVWFGQMRTEVLINWY